MGLTPPVWNPVATSVSSEQREFTPCSHALAFPDPPTRITIRSFTVWPRARARAQTSSPGLANSPVLYFNRAKRVFADQLGHCVPVLLKWSCKENNDAREACSLVLCSAEANSVAGSWPKRNNAWSRVGKEKDRVTMRGKSGGEWWLWRLIRGGGYSPVPAKFHLWTGIKISKTRREKV